MASMKKISQGRKSFRLCLMQPTTSKTLNRVMKRQVTRVTDARILPPLENSMLNRSKVNCQ